jgi:cytochrome P450
MAGGSVDVSGVPSSSIPISEVDPFASDVLADPQPFYASLRAAGPVVYLTQHGVYAVAQYEQVRDALRNWQVFQSGAGVGLETFQPEETGPPPSLLLEADPPVHDAPRHVLSSLLIPRALRRLAGSWAAAAQQLVDSLLARGTCFDAVQALAEAYPLLVFPDAIGICRGGREKLLEYGDLLFNAFGPTNELAAKGAPRMAELSAWISAQCARDALTPGGLGEEVWRAADRGDITHEQAPLVIRPLLSAGVDTTVHALAAVLYAFATHPDLWQRLVDEPHLIRVAFDETVRWSSPVRTFFRTTVGDVQIGPVVIPARSKVLICLAAANRDPRHWTDPAAFDLDRDPSGHVGFGLGIHQCVGQHVARLQAECLLRAMVARIDRIELTDPPVPHLNNTLMGWDSLPIRVRAR